MSRPPLAHCGRGRELAYADLRRVVLFACLAVHAGRSTPSVCFGGELSDGLEGPFMAVLRLSVDGLESTASSHTSSGSGRSTLDIKRTGKDGPAGALHAEWLCIFGLLEA